MGKEWLCYDEWLCEYVCGASSMHRGAAITPVRVWGMGGRVGAPRPPRPSRPRPTIPTRNSLLDLKLRLLTLPLLLLNLALELPRLTLALALPLLSLLLGSQRCSTERPPCPRRHLSRVHGKLAQAQVAIQRIPFLYRLGKNAILTMGVHPGTLDAF